MDKDYRTGRFMARIVSALGWLMIAGSTLGLLALLALHLSRQPNPDPLSASIWSGFAAYAVPVTLAVMVQGVFFVTLGQALRAIMDTARTSKQLLDYVTKAQS